MIVPEIYVYLVRLHDGGHLLPRAKVTLNLAGVSPDLQRLPRAGDVLSRELTLDLFDPPQRERIRQEAVRLKAAGLKQKEIAAAIEERPTVTAVQRALALNRKVTQMGSDSPYVLVLEPPADYTKLRRHKNPKYRFQTLDAYERPQL